jgi:alpha-methylacyl-CoA racemase
VGPLAGLKVIELVGQGPGPFAGMLLADMGAEVVRVDRVDRVQARPADPGRPATFPHDRGKTSVAIDLKQPAGVETLLRMVGGADVLIEPFRPGVAERLGIGPEDCHGRNPALIYGRMTGWGQDGPWAQSAGHDIDYIALAGALDQIGRAGQPPTPPVNVLGDFAGGGLLLAFGIACAAFERATNLGPAPGQVIDAAMIDGAALLFAPFFRARAIGSWGPRGTNHLDTAAHFYEVYETADDRWMAVGAIEPQFYAELLERLDLAKDHELANGQWARERWPEFKTRLAAAFRTRTRDEWCEVFEGRDGCAAPVLDPVEAPDHPHHRARGTFIQVEGVIQPGPAPRFSRTPASRPNPPVHPGANTDQVLSRWGFGPDELADLRVQGAIT